MYIYISVFCNEKDKKITGETQQKATLLRFFLCEEKS